ncbi:MAG: UDP-N-acetylmuramoyl-tripeptide--D-alanyl-D-alanine ligase [Acidobacteriota bacterium]|nr:UDP-N-acetylmuramoyl-tripeptide--D-alanyl-D-alanine ligase [Acidobacteriota bacterium]
MIERAAAELATVTGGRVVRGPADAHARGVSIDSRLVEKDDLFVAIRGPRHDGHTFAGDAAAAGAAVVLADHDLAEAGAAAVVVVADTTAALGSLAADERRRLGLKVVAVTGSSGKTTTRELAGAAIGARFRSYTSPGNLNNQWGLPLSLLRIPGGTEVAVLEMGMNHAGEIAALTRIAGPDVGVVTNVGSAHLGFFPDLRALAAAKAELLYEMPERATGVVHADSPTLMEFAVGSGRKLIRFGLTEAAELRARHLAGGLRTGMSFEVDGQEIRVRQWGRHAVLNALAALGAALALDVPLGEAAPRLSRVPPMDGRGRLHALSAGSLLVDESYNSNPAAASAVLEALGEFEWKGRRVAVLGDMLELGDTAAEHHREIGRAAGRHGVDRLFAVGSFAGELATGAREAGLTSVTEHADADEALDTLVREIAASDLIVVKGSRGTRLDRVVDALIERFGEETQR